MPNLRGPSECSRTIPCRHGFGDVQKRLFSGNLESYGDRESPLLLKVDELLLFFSALNEVHNLLNTETTGLKNVKQPFHAGHRQFMRLFTILDSTALFGILKCDGFFPLRIILAFLLNKGALVLETIKVDFAIHQAIGGLLLNAEPRKRGCQVQNGIKPIGMNHVNHTQTIGLQPVGRIIRQDLGIRKIVDNLVQHEDVAEGFGSKDRRLTNVSLRELGAWAVHTSPIQHGLRNVDTNLRNIGLTEPTCIGSRSTGCIQEFQFILVPTIDGDLTKRRTNLAHDVRCMKQRILERRLELIPWVFDDDTLPFLVFESLDNSLD